MKKIFSLLLLSSLFFCLTGTALAAATLQRGATGHDVRVLQQNLQNAGYAIRSIDGIFGNETYRAVINFQRDTKIKISGIVDNTTWRALEKAPKKSTPALSNAPALNTGTTVLRPAVTVPEGPPFLERSKVTILLATAKKYIGTPYQFGGATPKAFDCSGYLQYVFRQNGLTIPRTADEQYKLGQKTTLRRQLEPGDLVFFTTYEPGASHCGIYLGDGKFIHVSAKKGVRIDDLDDAYWKPLYYGGKHIVK